MNEIKQQHDFVFDYEFKLFTFPQFEIDGTSNELGCDLFIYDTKKNITYNIQYDDKIITFQIDRKDNVTEHYDFIKLAEFEFCENFEEKIFEIYKNHII